MENTQYRFVIVGSLAIVILGVGAWWYTSRPAMYPFEFVAGEEVTSWDFQGAYTGQAEFEEKGRTDITRLKELFGQEGYTDYELYVSLANQYELLGDGRGAYDNLLRAIAIDPENTGLAWHNLGKLLERFGAYESARIAYDAMVDAQPILQYQNVRVEFLKMRMPENTEAIKQAENQLNSTLGEFILE